MPRIAQFDEWRSWVGTDKHRGHDFFVGAHDRGGRVAHLPCLDFPKGVKKVCLMDIAPTLTMYRQTNQEFATKYMGWWFFLIQAAPLPEHLIGLDPQYYLEYNLSVLNKTPGALPPESIEGVSSLLLLHVNDSWHVRGFQSVCGHRS